jgi:hypothetical protein
MIASPIVSFTLLKVKEISWHVLIEGNQEGHSMVIRPMSAESSSKDVMGQDGIEEGRSDDFKDGCEGSDEGRVDEGCKSTDGVWEGLEDGRDNKGGSDCEGFSEDSAGVSSGVGIEDGLELLPQSKKSYFRLM